VHEHWNSPLHRQYTRNLGTGDGIELTCPVKVDFDGDSDVRFADLATFSAQWQTVSADLSARGGDGVVNRCDFAAFARHWTDHPVFSVEPNDPTPSPVLSDPKKPSVD